MAKNTKGLSMQTHAACFKVASRHYSLISPLLWAFLTILPMALAVNPPPDGGYPNQNTAEGEDALFSLTTGANNTAVGYHALYSITDSSESTAIGWEALMSATNGPNTAVGSYVLANNTTGYNNTAVGGLYSNTTGHDNTSFGNALSSNTTGSFNTAIGQAALYGGNGDSNCVLGENAMGYFADGSQNVAIGDSALTDGKDQNVAVGYQALEETTSSHNIGIGAQAGANIKGGAGNIMIGNTGSKNDVNKIRIGTAQASTYIAGISGKTVADGVTVLIGPDGQLGTLNSSARYKDEIEPMGGSSEVILALQPVRFRYKPELDPAGIPQFGLVAEQVEETAPELVARDASGNAYSVRYEAVNAMLLNEFQKEHRNAQARGAVIQTQQKRILQLEAALKNLQSSVEQQAVQLRRLKAAKAPPPQLQVTATE
jgi:hypothetical protein